MSTSPTFQIGQQVYSFEQQIGSLYGDHNLSFTLHPLDSHFPQESQITYIIEPWPLFTEPKTRQRIIEIALKELGQLCQHSALNPHHFKFEAFVDDLSWTFIATLQKPREDC